MSSLVKRITEKQQEKLEEFRKRVADLVKPEHLKDDGYLLRWLKARNFDLKKSHEMLEKHMNWRKKWDVDNIKQWKCPEVITKYMPGGFFGQTKDGYPIYIEPVGGMDLRGMLMSVRTKDFLLCTIEIMEKMVTAIHERAKENGEHIDKIVAIEDMEDFGYSQIFSPGVKTLMTLSFDLMELNYPEILKTIYVINAPGIMPALWNILKPFLSEDTRSRIKVLGKNYKEVLLQDIDPDQLPKHYGGTATDPDGNEYCASKVKQGGKIPEEYYLTGAKLVDDDKVTTTHVKKGTKLDLEYSANQGDALRWVFWTEKGDIEFGVFVKKPDGELSAIEASARVDCHKLPEFGAVECPETSTYLVRFDNSYSWVTPKTLHYSIEIAQLDTTDDVDYERDREESRLSADNVE